MSQNMVAKAMLRDTVTTRRVPMTEEGMSNLRAIRQYYIDEFKKRSPNKDIEIPYPSVFDMILRDFVKERNIHVSSSVGTNAD